MDEVQPATLTTLAKTERRESREGGWRPVGLVFDLGCNECQGVVVTRRTPPMPASQEEFVLLDTGRFKQLLLKF